MTRSDETLRFRSLFFSIKFSEFDLKCHFGVFFLIYTFILGRVTTGLRKFVFRSALQARVTAH